MTWPGNPDRAATTAASASFHLKFRRWKCTVIEPSLELT